MHKNIQIFEESLIENSCLNVTFGYDSPQNKPLNEIQRYLYFLKYSQVKYDPNVDFILATLCFKGKLGTYMSPLPPTTETVMLLEVSMFLNSFPHQAIKADRLP